MKIQEYVNIKDYSTFKIGGQFRYFIIINNIDDLKKALSFSKEKSIPIFILGGGSNIIFRDDVLNIVALKIEIKGFEIILETDEYIDIKIGAGENWDKIVEKTVNMNLSGLEALSAIPGVVGSSPVQNIGAYGSEVKDTIQEVEVFDIEKGIIKNILNKDCKFGYRDSIFKNEDKGKYIITNVVYRLNKEFWKNPYENGLAELPKKFGEEIRGPFQKDFSKTLSYPGVMKYFEDREINNPTLKEIRNAIITIRKDKLPNPKDIPNVGSFFKNPIVHNDVAQKIRIDFPDVKFYSIDENHIKIPAGWLIENAGFKGQSFGNISVYNKNALVLVNNGNASFDDVLKTSEEIIRIVKEKFEITLEQEPEII